MVYCIFFFLSFILQTLRRGIAAARPMSKSVQLSPSMACRTIVNLPNLPEDEGVNWSKEIYGAR
jgi:hypothetical protein